MNHKIGVYGPIKEVKRKQTTNQAPFMYCLSRGLLSTFLFSGFDTTISLFEKCWSNFFHWLSRCWGAKAAMGIENS